MVQKSPASDEITILILGTTRGEKRDFFSKLNSFSLLKVIGKDERTILNIPAWPALVALVAFFVVRAMRAKQS